MDFELTADQRAIQALTHELAEAGANLGDVSRFSMALRKRDVLSGQRTGHADRLGDPGVEAAFPESVLGTLLRGPHG